MGAVGGTVVGVGVGAAGGAVVGVIVGTVVGVSAGTPSSLALFGVVSRMCLSTSEEVTGMTVGSWFSAWTRMASPAVTILMSLGMVRLKP